LRVFNGVYGAAQHEGFLIRRNNLSAPRSG
jgi:hypothetical protein